MAKAMTGRKMLEVGKDPGDWRHGDKCQGMPKDLGWQYLRLITAAAQYKPDNLLPNPPGQAPLVQTPNWEKKLTSREFQRMQC